MRKFTIVTGHGKLDFVQKENGSLEFISLNGKSLSKIEKIGKLGMSKKVAVEEKK